LSLSADRNSLVTSRPELRISVWVGDGTAARGKDAVAPAPFLSSAGQYATVAWDGSQLLFTHTLNGHFEIFRTNADDPGQNPQAVVAGREMSTSTAGTIAFRSIVGDDVGLWTVDRNGRNARQLAKGSVSFPLIAADGRHVIYNGPTDEGQLLFRVATDGSAPEPVVPQTVNIYGFTDIGPDGHSIVFARGGQWVLCDFADCREPKPVSRVRGLRPRWTPDGRGIAYIDADDFTNVWVQPIDGSPPHQLTHFTDGHNIGNFAWSRDGQRFAVSRATFTTDIVLFRGLQRPE
jgi:dipeptidyl aminopeptidase/acylaminoacyl peptidase